jgi:AcrR family transcriptional regulator
VTTPIRQPMRDVARRAVQAELVAIAQKLFEERGYEATTVDTIATEAGMSRRTFFRYFASKDELVLGKYDLMGDQLLDALGSRPDDEPLWDSLRTMFESVGASDEANAEVHPIEAIVEDTPSLRASYLYRLDVIQRHLVEVARTRAARLGTPYEADNPTPEVLVRMAFACMLAARSAAVGSDQPWPTIVERALGVGRPAGATGRGEVHDG